MFFLLDLTEQSMQMSVDFIRLKSYEVMATNAQ